MAAAELQEFGLLARRRFCPLFITQFLGAFNDNLFKNALIMLIAFSKPQTTLSQDTLINLCAALFILPYFLFSAFAGQLADKYEKSRLIIYIKLVEVVLAVLVIVGFYWNSLFILLTALFLLGIQCTFFGPVKYSILPQHLRDSELMGGNGLIEMGTFLAILIGTLSGGLLIAIPETGAIWVSTAMLLTALLGLASSFFIPKAKPYSPDLILNWNFLSQTFSITREACQNPVIYYAIIGISWFWLFGSIVLTQIANYTKINLSGNEHVATALLVSFSVGIGLGSVLCEWLSNKKIEIGFVFLGGIGLTLFSLDFALADSPPPDALLDIFSFIHYGQNWRLLSDGFLMGSFGGIFVVPLYTLILKYSKPSHRSRIIAATNIISAFFMVIASVIAILVLNAGFSIPQLFILIALLNGAMIFYLFNLNKLVLKI